MKKKKAIIVCVLLYGLLTCFFYVRNVVFAKERTLIQHIVEEERIESRDARSILRAFYTAPPVVPHEIEMQDTQDCLRCHLNVTRLDDGRVAKETPHPQFSSCLQCHVPGANNEFNTNGTSWEGLEEPKRGDRWATMAPPMIPHRIKLRENCLSCHGSQNPDMRLRTTHPERTSCLQCHVPNYNNEFELDQE